MTISSVGASQAAQLKALSVTNVVDGAATSQTSDQTASSVVKVSAGLRISGRTAQSLTDILQAVQNNLGYSKEETKAFKAMIKAARDYLDKIKNLVAGAEAAATSTDPDKIAIDEQFQATKEGQAQAQKVKAYGGDFVAKMESSLDDVMQAFLDHKLVFQSFSIGVTGDVSIMAKTFTQGDDGKLKTDLSFSFFQSQIDDDKKSKTDPVQYGTIWSVNDLRLFNVGEDRVL